VEQKTSRRISSIIWKSSMFPTFRYILCCNDCSSCPHNCAKTISTSTASSLGAGHPILFEWSRRPRICHRGPGRAATDIAKAGSITCQPVANSECDSLRSAGLRPSESVVWDIDSVNTRFCRRAARSEYISLYSFHPSFRYIAHVFLY
jgi:hypothetical protein